jgi:hypothetical protein
MVTVARRAWYLCSTSILSVAACQPGTSPIPAAASSTPAVPTPSVESPSPSPTAPQAEQAAAPADGAPTPSSAEEVVQQLVTGLPPTLDADALDVVRAGIAKSPAVARAELSRGTRVSLVIELEPPLTGSKLAELAGWKDVYVVSGDVHQRNWYLTLGRGPVPDAHNKRIAVETPAIGPWQVRAHASARPAGPSPGVVAGASPAFPLATYAVSIDRIEIATPP